MSEVTQRRPTAKATEPNPAREEDTPGERAAGGLFDMLASILEPGTGPRLVMFLNITLVLLIMVLVFLLYHTDFDFHVVVFCALAVGLMVSINWFLLQLAAIPDLDAKAENAPPNHDQ